MQILIQQQGGAPSEVPQAHTSAPAPRLVITGGNKDQNPICSPESPSVDTETGEQVERYTNGHRAIHLRKLTPLPNASERLALVDALAFTIVTPDKPSDVGWLTKQMGQFLEIADIQNKGGRFGFKQSALFGEGAGIIAWGGKKQRGCVYFSIQGKGCGMVRDWKAFSEWLEQHHCTLKRVDVAHDDFDGSTVNIKWAMQQYLEEGFCTGGRMPKHSTAGDWLLNEKSVQGRTLYIGQRKNGKMCRVYEKGKAMGDPRNPWTRVEVEWHGTDRILPYDILVKAGNYLAGAYPCLNFLSIEQSRIKTTKKAHAISYEQTVKWAKQSVGRTLNAMCEVEQGDIAAVFAQVVREGKPKRLAALPDRVQDD